MTLRLKQVGGGRALQAAEMGLVNTQESVPNENAVMRPRKDIIIVTSKMVKINKPLGLCRSDMKIQDT